MLKHLLKNKVLSCLMFVAAVCQPVHASATLDQVNEWLDQMVKAAEKREAESRAKTIEEQAHSKTVKNEVWDEGQYIDDTPQEIVSWANEPEQIQEVAKNETEKRKSALNHGDEEIHSFLRDLIPVIPYEGKVKASKEVAAAEVKPEKAKDIQVVSAPTPSKIENEDSVIAEVSPRPMTVATAQKENDALSDTGNIPQGTRKKHSDLEDLLDNMEKEITGIPAVSEENTLASEKYDLKTGKPIATIPSRITVDGVDFLLDDGKSLPKLEKTDQMAIKTQTLDIEGTPFLIADTSTSAKPKVVQSDLNDLLDGLEKMEQAKIQSASKDLSEKEKDDLKRLLNKENFENTSVQSPQKDLQNLLAGLSDEKKKAETVVKAPAPARDTIKDINDLMNDLSGEDTRDTSVKKEDANSEKATVVARDTLSDINELLAETEKPKEPVVKKEEKAPVQEPIVVKKSARDDLNELLELTGSNKEEKPQEKDGFFARLKNSVMSIFACGALAVAGRFAIKMRHNKGPKTPAQAPLPKMEIVSPKTKSEEGQKVLEGPSPERREKLAERLVDIKVLSEIKEKRALLTREMAKARRQNDKATMDRITAERERLTEKKKALCLRMTGAQKAEIKEKRRLLTKQMTIARRQKDMQAMEQITAERQKLNAVTKALTGYIKKVDYRQIQKAYMKPEVRAILQRKKYEFARAA